MKKEFIVYGSRALADTETRCAQIEQELLATVWSCDKFDQYLYGRDAVTIENDHEPLKQIHKSSKHLQCMHLTLQKYNLDVLYKKGPLMYIADALSRVYVETTEGAGAVFSDI